MAPTPVADNVAGDVREALALPGRGVVVNARFDPSPRLQPPQRAGTDRYCAARHGVSATGYHARAKLPGGCADHGEDECPVDCVEGVGRNFALHTVALLFVVESLEWNLYWSESAGNDPASQWMRETFLLYFRYALTDMCAF